MFCTKMYLSAVCKLWNKIKKSKYWSLKSDSVTAISVSMLVCVAAVSPSANSYNETLSTLRYAAHARNIVNKPRVNEVSGYLESDARM